MKILFDLQAERKPGTDHDLLVEAGSGYCAYAYRHKPSNSIDAVRFVAFEPMEAATALPLVFEQAKGDVSFQSVVVCSAFPQALLVPNKLVNEVDDTLLPHLFGGSKAPQFRDAIPEWQVTTVYSLPLFFADAVTQAFPSANYLHAYTPAIKIYNGFIAENQVLVHFTAQQFRVLVKKNAALQLAQTYAYKTPLDVVYYLLKICYELGLQQAETHLVLSGLVEKESGLISEVQQYFQNVHFAAPPEMTLPQGDHPPYYFTSLYNLAACAS